MKLASKQENLRLERIVLSLSWVFASGIPQHQHRDSFPILTTYYPTSRSSNRSVMNIPTSLPNETAISLAEVVNETSLAVLEPRRTI